MTEVERLRAALATVKDQIIAWRLQKEAHGWAPLDEDMRHTLFNIDTALILSSPKVIVKGAEL